MVDVGDRTVRGLLDEPGDWDGVKWWRLELRTLVDAAPAQAKVALLGPREAWRAEVPRFAAGSCLQSLAFMLALALPALSAAMMVQWLVIQGASRWDMPLMYAGPLTAFALLVNAHGEVQELRTPRYAGATITWTLALWNIIPGVLVLGIGLTAARPFWDGSEVWLWAVAANVALAMWTVIRFSVQKSGPQDDLQNVDQAVSEMRPEARGTALEERDAAIRELVARGRITPEFGEMALAAPLGHLGRTVAPQVMSPFGAHAVSRAGQGERDASGS